jgi:hypothetical protein
VAAEVRTVRLEAELEAIVRAAPSLMRVLETSRELDLPDWLIVSGAVYQPVLNRLTGRDPDYGIKDYDLIYFDAADISYADLVEVRNQARVHLWFEGKFGEAYAPLSCSAEALERFVSPLFAVGVRLERDDALTVVAPFGLEDLFALRLAPNPRRRTRGSTARRPICWPGGRR